MAPFVEVVVLAFAYQLAVLPGEKAQFIIAGLSTRFHPLLVVAAAGSAFAGWTVLEIIFGELLTQVLPRVLLDAITAGLFLLFAILLVRSAPDGERAPVATDDLDGSDLGISVRGWSLDDRFGAFVPIFAMMTAGEFGDKTQLVTIGLAAQYGAHPGIWIGEMLAIIPVSLANAYLFHTVIGRFEVRKAHFVGAAIFLFFGIDTLLSIVIGVSLWERAVGILAAALLSLPV